MDSLLLVISLSAQLAGASASRLVDVDGDGRLDRLAVRNGTLSVRWSEGGRAFSAEQTLIARSVRAFLLMDLDGDARSDVYVVRDGANYGLVADSARGFVDATASLGLADTGVGIGVDRVDIDADGLDDILLRNENEDVVFWALPGGGFARDEAAPPEVPSGLGGAGSSGLDSEQIPNGTLQSSSVGGFLNGTLELGLTQEPPPGYVNSGMTLFASSGGELWGEVTFGVYGRRGAVAGAIGDKIYVAGGINGTFYQTDSEVYDSTTDTWSAIASMPGPLTWGGGGAFGDELYAISGYDGTNYTGTVYVYHSTSDAWSVGSPVPGGIATKAVARVGDKFYLMGGYDDAGVIHDDVLEYDTSSDTWTAKSPLPLGPREFASAVAIDGKIIVVGGRNQSSYLSDVEEYDPATDTYRTLPSTPTPLYFSAFVEHDGRALIFGGFDGTSNSRATLEYNPFHESWTYLLPSPAGTDPFDAVAANLDDLVYVFGGIAPTNGARTYRRGVQMLFIHQRE